MNHGWLMAASVSISAVPVLPATVDALERRRGARALAHDVAPSSPSPRAAVRSLHDPRGLLGLERVDRAPVAVDDPLVEVRLHAARRRWRPPAATIAICSGVTQQLVLADRDAPDVDAA